MKTNYYTSTKILGLKILHRKEIDTMKIENDTIVLLPNGELTNGERILRALALEKKLLVFAKEGELDG